MYIYFKLNYKMFGQTKKFNVKINIYKKNLKTYIRLNSFKQSRKTIKINKLKLKKKKIK